MALLSGTTRLDDRGRLVLPKEMRSRLGLKPGDEVMITETAGGALRVESRRVAARGLIGSAGASSEPMLEDLRALRREQAAAETRRSARTQV
jgi:AbrB family transcriptional regulator (stage V sporulation protein T)